MYEVESFMKGDIFSYGLVLYYMVTGDKPWAVEESHAAGDERRYNALPQYPDNLGKGPLKDLYDSCISLVPEERPTAWQIINNKFQGKSNCCNKHLKVDVYCEPLTANGKLQIVF